MNFGNPSLKHLVWQDLVFLYGYQAYNRALLDHAKLRADIWESGKDFETKQEALTAYTGLTTSIIAIKQTRYLDAYGKCGSEFLYGALYEDYTLDSLGMCFDPQDEFLSLPFCRWYIDTDMEFRSEEVSRDRADNIIYRIIKAGVTEEQLEKMNSALYLGPEKCSEYDAIVDAATDKLGPVVAVILGLEVD